MKHSWIAGLIVAIVVSGGALLLWSELSAARRAQTKGDIEFFGVPPKVAITRKPKPRRPKPPAPVAQAPLLALQWWLVMRGRDCRAQEIDPQAIFVKGDQLRLGVQVNQSGHLYVIASLPDAEEGFLLFPEARINAGRNEMKLNDIFYAPYGCSLQGAQRDSRCPADADVAYDCWWKMVGPYVDKQLTIVFSREEVTELERVLGDKSVEAVLPRVPLNVLAEIKEKLVAPKFLQREGQRPQTGKFGTLDKNFITRITNTNRDDNEEIVETITLKNREQ